MHAEFAHGRFYACMNACRHARIFDVCMCGSMDACMPTGTAVTAANVELAYLTREHLPAPVRPRVDHTAALPKPPAVHHGTPQPGPELKSDSR